MDKLLQMVQTNGIIETNWCMIVYKVVYLQKLIIILKSKISFQMKMGSSGILPKDKQSFNQWWNAL